MNLGITAIACLVCILIVYYIRTKNQERMKLIDLGLNPDEGLNVSEYRKQSSLQNGILFVSLGLGLFTGHLLVINYEIMDELITYLISLLLFCGIGFLVNFLIIRNWNTK